ncbi:DUF4883 family protein [Clostridium sp.]|jgi:hypothetical protein|uniref:DUF4883 family protein n=1 Tax=Clostridium sp. TaxID=1506 RepID=UPI003A5C1BD9
MKKILLYATIIFTIFILLTGCTNNLNLLNLNSKKPNTFYYTAKLLKYINQEKPSKCIMSETNFHKEKQLDAKTVEDIKTMFKSLDEKNFIESVKNLPSKPKYKIILTFKEEKLLINVYNENYISVYPWDGIYSMDYIDTSKIPVSLNLYNLGNYVFKQ